MSLKTDIWSCGSQDLSITGALTLPGGKTTCYRSLLIRNRKPTKLRSLNLVDLGSAFFILGLGYLLSMLAFLLEQSRRYKPKSKASILPNL